MLERLLEKLPRVVLFLIPVAAAAILYLIPALQNGFVSLDDGLLITKNPAVMALTPRTVWHVFTHYDPELYIPVTFISYQFDHLVWGLNPVGFHLMNLLLHAASAGLLAFIILKVSGSRLAALVVALLFAVHPLNTEAVLWAAARKDVLSTFLALVSAATFVLYRQEEKQKWYRAAVVFFILALLAKVSIVVLPVFFLLYDRICGRKFDRSAVREYLPFAAAMLVFVVIAVIGKTGVLQSSGPLQTLLLACKSAAFYLQQLIWPSGLTVIYPQQTPVILASPEFFIPVAGILAFLIAVIALRKRRPVASALILVFLIALVPNSTNFFKNSMLFFASDRYAYIAALGIFGLAAWLVRSLDRKENVVLSSITGVVSIAVIAALSLAASVQAQTWKDSETLYTRVLEVYPESALAWNNLGDIQMKAGKREQAMESFDRAIASDPSLMSPHLNRGDALRISGDLQAAETELKIAVDLIEKKTVSNLEELGAYYYLGRLYDETGHVEESLAVFRRAVERLPDSAEPHYNLGVMLQKHRRTEEALLEFLRTVQREPLYIAGWYHAAGILAEQGKLDEAEVALERVVELDPGYEKASEHLQSIRALRQ